MNAFLLGVTCSKLTLEIMPWVAMLFVPISLLYTSWCYVGVWRRIKPDFIEQNNISDY